MRTIVVDAKVQIQLPDVLDPIEYSEELYIKKPRVRMKLHLKVDNLVVREPRGRTITLRQVILDRIEGIILPVVEGDMVVMFKVDEPDEPIRVEGGT
jgi:hypothetical protein